MSEAEDILSLEEVEVYTSHITLTKIKEIGSFSWFKNHERLHRLFQQAVLEASDSREERVKESLLLHGKIQSLVCEAICISVWRELVLPQLFSEGHEIQDVFPLYTVMYQETTALGLLETILFHQDCTNSLGGSAIDLIDYCHDTILHVINRPMTRACPKEDIREELSPKEELEYYASVISLDVAVRSVCVLRYVTENFEQLPVCITSHFYSKFDFPALLSKLLDIRPWASVSDDGKKYIFTDSRWKIMNNEDDGALPKVEVQVWLCLRHIILDKNFLQYYELNDFRKRELSKLLSYLHDTVLDQLSPLAELKHFICQISVANIPPPRNKTVPLILEVGAEYREHLLAHTHKNLKKYASKQAALFSKMDYKQLQEIAKSLATTYNTLDLIDPEASRCSNCGDPAPRRCSRCKSEWYCGRECQVKRWTKHKTVCDLMCQSASQIEEHN